MPNSLKEIKRRYVDCSFATSALLTLCLISLDCGGDTVHCTMCSSIPGFYPLGTKSIFSFMTNNKISKHCQISPGGKIPPQLRTIVQDWWEWEWVFLFLWGFFNYYYWMVRKDLFEAKKKKKKPTRKYFGRKLSRQGWTVSTKAVGDNELEVLKEKTEPCLTKAQKQEMVSERQTRQEEIELYRLW